MCMWKGERGGECRILYIYLYILANREEKWIRFGCSDGRFLGLPVCSEFTHRFKKLKREEEIVWNSNSVFIYLKNKNKNLMVMLFKAWPEHLKIAILSFIEKSLFLLTLISGYTLGFQELSSYKKLRFHLPLNGPLEIFQGLSFSMNPTICSHIL